MVDFQESKNAMVGKVKLKVTKNRNRNTGEKYPRQKIHTYVSYVSYLCDTKENWNSSFHI